VRSFSGAAKRYLTLGPVLPRHHKGSTALREGEFLAQDAPRAIEVTKLAGLPEWALITIMVCGFACVGSASQWIPWTTDSPLDLAELPHSCKAGRGPCPRRQYNGGKSWQRLK
jgi:hypothetical protein